MMLGALALWGLAPVLLMIVHALGAGQRLTGADGAIPADQLQYLAWIRDAGSHGLVSNLFDLAPSSHVYAQPMFILSGALWRIGLPLAAAYLLWKPIAVAVLFAGAAWWTKRLIPDSPGARVSALGLSLFLFTPIAWLVGWASIGSQTSQSNVLTVASEMFPAGVLWGYLPSAIAIGLMPVALLATERALRPGATNTRGALLLAGSAALLVSWLHPWQGAILELILVGLVVWGSGREWRAYAVPIAAAALPLAYYFLLPHLDSAWKLASHNEAVPRLPALALLAGLGPPALLAFAGVRAPGEDAIERALLLWVPASVVTYFVLSSFPSHGLESISLPLAVLAVRGWQRLARARLPAVVAALAVAAVTLPGMAYDVRAFRDIADAPGQLFYLTRSESHALNWIANHAPPGGVLAPASFALVVPSQTGRAVWVGHEFWSRDYFVRAQVADELFAGRLTPRVARAAVLLSGARLLASGCAERTNLVPVLAAVLASVHHFGCAVVYVVKRPRAAM
jgi:hypothetical protein